MLFQIHIPKTGGTTLFRMLEQHFPPEQVVLVTVGGLTHQDLRAQIEHAELVAGHLTWAAIAAFPRPPKVLTILRDPVERSLSLYRYFRKYAEAGVFSAETQRLANEARARTLSDALLDPTSLLRRVVTNVQVDFLSSEFTDYRMPTGDLQEADLVRRLDVAVRNLESCAWVGTTETLNRDLQTLSIRCGWIPLAMPERQMVTGECPDESKLTIRARRELNRIVAADRELHSRARALADERYRLMVEPLQSD